MYRVIGILILCLLAFTAAVAKQVQQTALEVAMDTTQSSDDSFSVCLRFASLGLDTSATIDRALLYVPHPDTSWTSNRYSVTVYPVASSWSAIQVGQGTLPEIVDSLGLESMVSGSASEPPAIDLTELIRLYYEEDLADQGLLLVIRCDAATRINVVSALVASPCSLMVYFTSASVD